MRTRALLTITAFFVLTANALLPESASAQESLRPADGISVSGLPGPLVLTGEATALLVGDIDGQVAVAAAESPLGKGRLVAFGHESFLNPTVEQSDARAFLRELGASLPAGKAIGVDHAFAHLIEILREAGFSVSILEAAAPDPASAAMFVDTRHLTPENLPAWKVYVESGGVLVTGVPGWGWLQTHPGKTLASDFSAGSLYASAGIHWTPDTFDSGEHFVRPATGSELNATHALATLSAGTAVSAERKIDACGTLQFAIGALPENDPTRKQIDALLRGVEIRWPTKDQPVPREDALNRLAILHAQQRERSLSADQVKANPAAADFPGAVPADAKSVARELAVDLATPGWFVTGLYAAPGATITVAVPASASTHGLKLRIGSTTCNDARHAKWVRAPQIDREWPIVSGTQTVASSFGGTIYLDVPDGLAGTLAVTIAGAIEQPVFELGVDTNQTWKQTRTLPAPWSELISPGIAISIPSEFVRTLENPAELMTWWQHLAEVQDSLSPRPGFPKRGERITLDRDICVGYMHAGYPIMTGLDVATTFVDLEMLKTKGNWGIYHELGHNHQWPDWTFDGTGEVTNNLFSLYCFARINPGVEGHKAMSDASKAKAMQSLWNPEGPADQFQRDPFYALMMYQQVIDRFGFEPFERFFAKASTRPEAERPMTDQAKRDRWLIDLSLEVGENLEPLMTSWGVVTSDDAKKAVAHLPTFKVAGIPAEAIGVPAAK